MIRAIRVHGGGSWTDAPTDTVVLEFDDRHRRRTVMNGVHGLAFLLDLPDAVMLRGGDALELEDGRLVEVVAAPEALVEVRAKRPGDLLRLAWHIGNRHLPAQITPHAIRIRQDHVIEAMLEGLGAKLVPIEGAFDPEGGAYAAGGAQATPDAQEHPPHKHHPGHGDHEGHHDHHGHDHGHKHDDHHGHKHGKHKHDH